MLQSPRLEYHMNNIDNYQSLCHRYSFEHKCLNKIKRIYQHAGNFDDQQNLKDIVDASMLSNPK